MIKRRDEGHRIAHIRTKLLPEVTYTSESQLRHPRQLLHRMAIDLLASRELAWRLFVRNIKSRYRQSLLGYFWTLLPPIVTTLVFVFLNSQKILNVRELDTGVPYPAYVMLGTLLWQSFVDALSSPIRLVTASRSMLVKISFPREALILAGLGEVLFNLGIRLVLVLAVFVWFHIPVPATALLAPFGVLSLITLGLVIGVLLTPLGVLYKDIQQTLAIVTSLWFFVTPVVYSPPTRWPASVLARVNPVSPLLVTTRELLTTGWVSQPSDFLLVTAATVVMLFVGWVLYRLALPHLIERMSA